MENMENSSGVLIIQNINTLRNKKSTKKGQVHVCPVNTRIVNHHIYKHTFSPCYTCCEENEVCNITEPCNPCCF